MSGAGTAAKPRLPFCWVCSRKLHGNFHRVAVVHGLEVVVHADCAKREGLEIKEGAHKRVGPKGLENASDPCSDSPRSKKLPPIKLRRLTARDGGTGFVIIAEPLPAHVRGCISDDEYMQRCDEERAAIDAEWKRIGQTGKR